MLSAEVQTSPLIHEYVQEIAPDLYGAFWMRRRIVAELTDHLLETAARLQRQGLSRAIAEERAIEQFGSPRLVAITFARSKGVGVPTTFTRYSGLAGALGAFIITAAFIWQEFSIQFMQGFFGEISSVGGVLVAISMFGIYFRTRGQLGRAGRFGFRLMFIGFVIGFGSSLMWFGPGAFLGLGVMLIGFFCYFVAVFRADVLPRAPLATLITGVAFALGLGLFGAGLGIDTGAVAATTGEVLIAIGFAGVGRYLWSERAVEPSEWTEPPLTA